MNKTDILIILLLIVSLILCFLIGYRSIRQDQEIEELRGNIITLFSREWICEGTNPIICNKKPLTQEPKECFDLVDKMIVCPSIELELP